MFKCEIKKSKNTIFLIPNIFSPRKDLTVTFNFSIYVYLTQSLHSKIVKVLWVFGGRAALPYTVTFDRVNAVN